MGAVYIYMGSKTGVNVLYSQRLSPKSFPFNLKPVRGFGQGLSRGVDIDGNGHNGKFLERLKTYKAFLK